MTLLLPGIRGVRPFRRGGGDATGLGFSVTVVRSAVPAAAVTGPGWTADPRYADPEMKRGFHGPMPRSAARHRAKQVFEIPRDTAVSRGLRKTCQTLLMSEFKAPDEIDLSPYCWCQNVFMAGAHDRRRDHLYDGRSIFDARIGTA